MKFETRLLHAAAAKDRYTGGLSVSIHPASTYHQHDVETRQEFDYSRSGNPTRKALEELIAAIEGGTHAYAFASGVAAVTAALTGVLNAGDHLVAAEQLYGGSYRIITEYLTRFGITHTFADTRDHDAVRAAITPQTKLLFLETPSNPLLHITDIDAMVAIAKERGLLTAMDNTFLSPLYFRPLERGVDISIESATKFLGGHSDLMAGTVAVKDTALAKKIYFVQNGTGNMLSPENSWLLIRGIKTLAARMRMQTEAATHLAHALQSVPWIAQVYYPGLSTHPGHEIMRTQCDGFGSVLSIETGSRERAKRVMERVALWNVAVSLGGVESILSYPARMSHAAMPAATRTALGITDGLLRLSPGLESPEDLLNDLIAAGGDA